MRNDIECYKNLFDLLLVLYKMREYLKSGNFKNDALPTKKLIVFEICWYHYVDTKKFCKMQIETKQWLIHRNTFIKIYNIGKWQLCLLR